MSIRGTMGLPKIKGQNVMTVTIIILTAIVALYLATAFAKFILLLGGMGGMVKALQDEGFMENTYFTAVVCFLSLFGYAMCWVFYIKGEGKEFFISPSNKAVYDHVRSIIKEAGSSH